MKIKPKKKTIKAKLLKNKNQSSLKDLIKCYEQVKMKKKMDEYYIAKMKTKAEKIVNLFNQILVSKKKHKNKDFLNKQMLKLREKAAITI